MQQNDLDFPVWMRNRSGGGIHYREGCVREPSYRIREVGLLPECTVCVGVNRSGRQAHCIGCLANSSYNASSSVNAWGQEYIICLHQPRAGRLVCKTSSSWWQNEIRLHLSRVFEHSKIETCCIVMPTIRDWLYLQLTRCTAFSPGKKCEYVLYDYSVV